MKKKAFPFLQLSFFSNFVLQLNKIQTTKIFLCFLFLLLLLFCFEIEKKNKPHSHLPSCVLLVFELFLLLPVTPRLCCNSHSLFFPAPLSGHAYPHLLPVVIKPKCLHSPHQLQLNQPLHLKNMISNRHSVSKTYCFRKRKNISRLIHQTSVLFKEKFLNI